MNGRTPALRGEKARWLHQAVQNGLRRPSAAWFSSATPDLTSRATAGAAVHLALASRGRAQLLSGRSRDQFTRVFHQDRGLLPALILFWDHPTGAEAWHRYHWTGPAAAPTAPYTKVERAGRTVDLDRAQVRLARATLDDIAHVEASLPDHDHPRWWGEPLLKRATADGRPSGDTAQTRLAVFCEELGALLGTRAEMCRGTG
ncbi:hypothetical protein AB0912_31385 [Streptomyces sp. NPDC007084]|uniref:hypothetical protein n=1 Tax=Streptomyces sp. NPDC007084 TaxID=3154313 RepID=UPI003453D75B